LFEPLEGSAAVKKLGLFFAVATVALAAGVNVAGAGTPPPPYPPGTPPLELSDTTVGPGDTFQVMLTGCQPGESVNFTVEGSSATSTCGGAAGAFRISAAGPTATASLTAPTTPGQYIVTATGLTSGVTSSAVLTVAGVGPTTTAAPGGGLPATGSDNAPIAQIAGGLVAAGAGLAIVASVRRRKATA